MLTTYWVWGEGVGGEGHGEWKGTSSNSAPATHVLEHVDTSVLRAGSGHRLVDFTFGPHVRDGIRDGQDLMQEESGWRAGSTQRGTCLPLAVWITEQEEGCRPSIPPTLLAHDASSSATSAKRGRKAPLPNTLRLEAVHGVSNSGHHNAAVALLPIPLARKAPATPAPTPRHTATKLLQHFRPKRLEVLASCEATSASTLQA
jgi:hypothetical protein